MTIQKKDQVTFSQKIIYSPHWSCINRIKQRLYLLFISCLSDMQNGWVHRISLILQEIFHVLFKWKWILVFPLKYSIIPLKSASILFVLFIPNQFQYFSIDTSPS